MYQHAICCKVWGAMLGHILDYCCLLGWEIVSVRIIAKIAVGAVVGVNVVLAVAHRM